MRPFVLVVIRKSEGWSHKLGREQFVGNIDPTYDMPFLNSHNWKNFLCWKLAKHNEIMDRPLFTTIALLSINLTLLLAFFKTL